MSCLRVSKDAGMAGAKGKRREKQVTGPGGLWRGLIDIMNTLAQL